MQSALSLKLKPTMVHRPVLAPKAKPKAKPKKYADGGTTSTQYVSNILPGSEGAYGQLVQNSQDLTDPTKTPYQPYEGERTAAFTPLQNQGYAGIAALGPSAQSTQAGGIAGLAANQAMNSSYDPSSFSTYGSAPQATGTQSFLQPGTAGAYMNPYQQQVTDIAKREATRADDIARTGRNAQAVGAGAFGGSRQAIVEAEANKNLQQHLGDIQAQGSDAAFKQAQAQFNAEQGLGLQSQIANQGAGLQYGSQFLDAQKLGEASKQFGANYGLEGLKTGISGATALSGVGNDLFKQGYTSATGQATAGADQRAAIQQDLDTKAAEYEKQQLDPYKRLGFMSDILHGTQGAVQNVTGSTTSTVPQASNMQNLVGLGLGLYGATKAKGGVIESGIARIAPDDIGDFADGGIVGYAGGGTSTIDWSLFDRPPPENARRLLPRLGAAAAEKMAAPVAEAAAEAAAKRGLLRTVGQVAGRASLPLTVGSTAYDLYARDQDAYDESGKAKQTDTDAGARMGFGYGLGGDFSGLVQPAPVKAPTADYSHEGRPQPQSGITQLDPVDQKKRDDMYGLASLVQGSQVARDPAPTVAGTLKNMKDAGVDKGFADYRLVAEGASNDLRDVERAQAQKYEKNLKELHESLGTLGQGREDSINKQRGEMAGREASLEKNALIKAGMSILAADPRGGWMAAVSRGALPVLEQYGVDTDKLRAEKYALDEKMNLLQDARRAEKGLKGEQLLAAQARTDAVETEAQKRLFGITNTLGVAEHITKPGEVFKAFDKSYSDWRATDKAVQLGNAASRTRLGLGAISAGFGGGAGDTGGMKPKDFEAAVDRRAKMLLTKGNGMITDPSTGEMVTDPARAFAIAQEIAKRSLSHGARAAAPAGLKILSVTDDD